MPKENKKEKLVAIKDMLSVIIFGILSLFSTNRIISIVSLFMVGVIVVSMGDHK